jgi:hypothetical protein
VTHGRVINGTQATAVSDTAKEDVTEVRSVDDDPSNVLSLTHVLVALVQLIE